MKKLFATGLFLGLLSPAFAEEKPDKKHPPKKKPGISVVAVGGDRAQAIFDALDVEAESKSNEKGTVDIKAVGGLKCLHFVGEEKEGYRCFLKGRSIKKRAQHLLP